MAKILIAEDEPDILELVAITLSTLGGFQVIKAKNGVEAVELAQAEAPDLILMDVRMPHMKLKETPATRDIPIAFLSAKGQEQEIEQGLKAGAEEYILKPFAPEVLLDKVREILGS
jgi:DNA-binding response OmpR family regulator